MDVFEKYGDPVVAIEKIPQKDVCRFGVIKPNQISERIYEIKDIVEKPAIKDAPSDLSIVGKYIITSDVFYELEKVKPGKDGEIRLADALKALVKKKAVYGYEFEGKRYDCGSKLGFLQATVDFALKHKEVSGEFKDYLKSLKL